jgi:hypothetical protein
MFEIKQLEGKVNISSKNNEELIRKEEEAHASTTLDVYFLFKTA